MHLGHIIACVMSLGSDDKLTLERGTVDSLLEKARKLHADMRRDHAAPERALPPWSNTAMSATTYANAGADIAVAELELILAEDPLHGGNAALWRGAACSAPVWRHASTPGTLAPEGKHWRAQEAPSVDPAALATSAAREAHASPQPLAYGASYGTLEDGARASRTSGPGNTPLATADWAGLDSLSVTLETVRVSKHMVSLIAGASGLKLKCVVPACGSADAVVVEDVVVAACRETSAGGSVLVFGHTSVHKIMLSAQTLPELAVRPLRLHLLLEEALPALAARKGQSSATGTHQVELAVADVLWHRALFADSHSCRLSAELTTPSPKPGGGGPVRASTKRRDAAAGQVWLTVALHSSEHQPRACTSSRTSALTSCHGVCVSAGCDLHVRTWLGRVQLREQALGNVQAVVKFSQTQELSVQATAEEAASTDEVASGQAYGRGIFDGSAISSSAVWQVDQESGECLRGPSPPQFFVQIWRGVELLGLARVPLPPRPSAEAVREALAAGGCLELVSEDFDVRGTGAVAAGATLGTVQVTVHAGSVAGLSRIQRELSDKTWAGVDLGRPPGIEIQRRLLTNARLSLAALDIPVEEDVVRAAGGDPADPSSRVSAERLHTMLQLAGGLASRDAALLLADVAREVQAVDTASLPAQAVHRVLHQLRARLEASVAGLAREAGEACGAIVEHLAELGRGQVVLSLGRPELATVLRACGVEVSWESMENFFSALEGGAGPDSGTAEVAATALARLMRRGAEIALREKARAMELEVAVLGKLQEHLGPSGFLGLLKPFMRADSTVDRLAVTVALDSAIGGALEGGSALARRVDLDCVVGALMQRLGDARGGRIAASTLVDWFQEFDGSSSLPEGVAAKAEVAATSPSYADVATESHLAMIQPFAPSRAPVPLQDVRLWGTSPCEEVGAPPAEKLEWRPRATELPRTLQRVRSTLRVPWSPVVDGAALADSLPPCDDQLATAIATALGIAPHRVRVLACSLRGDVARQLPASSLSLCTELVDAAEAEAGGAFPSAAGATQELAAQAAAPHSRLRAALLEALRSAQRSAAESAGPHAASCRLCLDLPSAALFAMLAAEASGQGGQGEGGRVPPGALRSFAERCLGLAGAGVAEAVAFTCGASPVQGATYASFRRYCACLDSRRSCSSASLTAFRNGVRLALRAAAHPDVPLEAGLAMQGLVLDDVVETSVAAELLDAPAEVVTSLVWWHQAARAALRVTEEAQPPTYRELINVLRRAHELQGTARLEVLFGACMAASRDFEEVLGAALWAPGGAAPGGAAPSGSAPGGAAWRPGGRVTGAEVAAAARSACLPCSSEVLRELEGEAGLDAEDLITAWRAFRSQRAELLSALRAKLVEATAAPRAAAAAALLLQAAGCIGAVVGGAPSFGGAVVAASA